MIEKASRNETEVMTVGELIPKRVNTGCSNCARKGSPTQPSPRLASVIPS